MDWMHTTLWLAILAGVGAVTFGSYLLGRAPQLGELAERIALVVFFVAASAVAISGVGVYEIDAKTPAAAATPPAVPGKPVAKPKAIGFKFPLRLGIDLSGGVVMVYEIDEGATKRLVTDPSGEMRETKLEIDVKGLVEQLKRRLDPSGTKELVVRPYGDKQVEVIIPKVESQDELDQIKTVITQAGFLEFRILASRRFDTAAVQAALSAADPREKLVYETGTKTPVAKWVRVGRDLPTGNDGSLPPFKYDFTYSPDIVVRDGRSGGPVPVDNPTVQAAVAATGRNESARLGALSTALEAIGVRDVEVLVMLDSHNVYGTHLQGVRSATGDNLLPKITFDMTYEGAILFGQLTGENAPVGDAKHKLGIVLDEQLLTAPDLLSRISDSGQITGNFTRREVDTLVQILQAGRLPAVLKKSPVSEQEISPLLGQDTIEKGQWAMVYSLVIVVIFMMVYYRPVAGSIAGFALVLNLVFTIAIMIVLRARLSLPGMAGLVLTVGMSVDANVLIYERLREELESGSTLKMAIRNGFGRALSTIIDSNLTTIITGLVLYAIGTDTIKGFAVTLVLGILTSMFTAIYCSRLMFDILDRKNWVSTLNFLHVFGKTNFDFVGIQRYCIGASLFLIFASFVIVGIRGKNMLDTDLMGGSSVQILLDKPMSADEVRRIVGTEWPSASVTNMKVTGLVDRIYKIDTPVTGEEPDWGEVEVLAHNPTPEEVWAGIERHKRVAGPDQSPPDGAEITELTFQFKLFKDKLQYNKLAVTDVQQVAAPITEAPGPAPGPTPGTPGVGPAPMTPAPAPMTPAPAPMTPAPAPMTPAPAPMTPAPAPMTTTPAPETPKAGEPKAGEPKAGEPAPAPSTPEPAPAPAPTPEKKSSFQSRPTASTLVAFQADAPAAEGEKKPEEKKAEPAAPAPVPAPAPAPAAEGEKKPEPAAPAPAPAAEVEKKPEPAAPAVEGEKKPDPATPAPMPMGTAPPTPATPIDIAKARAVASGAITTATLEFGTSLDKGALRDSVSKVDGEGVRQRVRRAAQRLGYEGAVVSVLPPKGVDIETVSGTTWVVTIHLPKEDAAAVFKEMERTINERPILPSSSRIGSLVAGNTQVLAIVAMLVSCLAIVVYVWFRFHKVIYGLAAVVALVHDVIITVGAMGICVWLTGAPSFLMLEDFKISLAVVAALLTIVGYSINDTIVVFDRIREVRGKIPVLTTEMVNDSVNQTLSRTTLTSFLTFLSTIILYFLGGPSIHAFAFAICVGIFVGTYSSIYIASPLLLFFEEPEALLSDRGPRKKEVTV